MPKRTILTGPPGCGKTTELFTRAAEELRDGKSVLLVSFDYGAERAVPAVQKLGVSAARLRVTTPATVRLHAELQEALSGRVPDALYIDGPIPRGHAPEDVMAWLTEHYPQMAVCIAAQCPRARRGRGLEVRACA